MSKSRWKYPILLLVFLLPIVWYLFLQFFGRNKFEVESFGTFSSFCTSESEFIVPNIYLSSKEQKNEWDRLTSNLNRRKVKLIGEYECSSLVDSGFMFLIDTENVIRGKYQLTSTEIDRLLVELDILIKEHK